MLLSKHRDGLQGGLRAVVWTDTLQTCVIDAGVLCGHATGTMDTLQTCVMMLVFCG